MAHQGQLTANGCNNRVTIHHVNGGTVNNMGINNTINGGMNAQNVGHHQNQMGGNNGVNMQMNNMQAQMNNMNLNMNNFAAFSQGIFGNMQRMQMFMNQQNPNGIQAQVQFNAQQGQPFFFGNNIGQFGNFNFNGNLPPGPGHHPGINMFQQGHQPTQQDGEFVTDRRGRRVAIISAKGCETSIEEDCLICMDKLNKKDDNCGLLQCLHWFHFECLKDWLIKDASCPLCKTQVSEALKTCP
jgi:hypothetical protein